MGHMWHAGRSLPRPGLQHIDHSWVTLCLRVKCGPPNTSMFPRKTKYRTGKDLYSWSRGKSRSFLLTLEFFSVFINELAFHGTNGSPILPICIQYSLAQTKVCGITETNRMAGIEN